jgi:hypothetical protein
MKLINLNTNIILALATSFLIAVAVPAQAEEAGFTLEDSIRKQIFLELKSNVESLYQNNQLLVPSIDTSAAARLASNTDANGFVLPISINGNAVAKDNTVGNIN